MNILRYLLSRLSSDTKGKLKKKIQKVKKKIKFWIKPLSLEEMEYILRFDLDISEGDKIFVTSAFGSLNAQFTPTELVLLLMKIVTPKGMILMPYYPPGSSAEWADSGAVFDMQNTKSAMGIVTNVFSKMQGVYKSIHPTKSIIGWGDSVEYLLEGHELASTPFSEDSPYGRFLKLENTKSLGIGTKKCPMGHCMEDIVSGALGHYRKEKSFIKVRNFNVEFDVPTLIHNPYRNQIPPSTFIKCCKDYKEKNVGYGFCFVINNTKAFDFYKKQFSNGKSSI